MNRDRYYYYYYYYHFHWNYLLHFCYFLFTFSPLLPISEIVHLIGPVCLVLIGVSTHCDEGTFFRWAKLNSILPKNPTDFCGDYPLTYFA